MELRRNEKITFRCTELEKDALAEQAARCSLSVSEYCRSFVPWGAPKGEVHRGGTAASPGHSPVERNAPTAEQLLRWSPVPGSVRGEPGTNYRAPKKYSHDDREREKHITWCGGIGVRPRQRDKRAGSSHRDSPA